MDRQSQAALPNLARSAILNDFRVDFYVSDTSLTIEAESLKNGEFFERVFYSGEIEEFSHQAFSTPEDIAEFIGYAIDKTDPNSSIAINEDAVITLSQTSKFGAKEKTLVYKLELKKKDVDPLEMCTKHIQKLHQMKEGGNLTPFEEQTIKILNQLVIFNRSKTQEKAKERIEAVF